MAAAFDFSGVGEEEGDDSFDFGVNAGDGSSTSFTFGSPDSANDTFTFSPVASGATPQVERRHDDALNLSFVSAAEADDEKTAANKQRLLDFSWHTDGSATLVVPHSPLALVDADEEVTRLKEELRATVSAGDAVDVFLMGMGWANAQVVSVRRQLGTLDVEGHGDLRIDSRLVAPSRMFTTQVESQAVLRERLCAAADAGDVERVRQLAPRIKNLNFMLQVACGAPANTILMSACLRGDEPSAAIAEALLDAGADVNDCQSIGRQRPLHGAAVSGNVALVKLLLERGADGHVQDDNNQYPLTKAVIAQNLPVVKFLLAHFKETSKIDHVGVAASFHWAINQTASSRRDGETDAAAYSVSDSGLKELFPEAAKALPTGATTAEQENATDGDAAVPRRVLFRILRLFLAAGVDPNCVFHDRSPLCLAALRNDAVLCQFLIQHGARVERIVIESLGHNSLDVVVSLGKALDGIELLSEYTDELDWERTDTRGSSLMELALGCGSTAALSALHRGRVRHILVNSYSFPREISALVLDYVPNKPHDFITSARYEEYLDSTPVTKDHTTACGGVRLMVSTRKKKKKKKKKKEKEKEKGGGDSSGSKQKTPPPFRFAAKPAPAEEEKEDAWSGMWAAEAKREERSMEFLLRDSPLMAGTFTSITPEEWRLVIRFIDKANGRLRKLAGPSEHWPAMHGVRLAFRGSEDGFNSSAELYRMCAGANPSLIVARGKNGAVFGAYTCSSLFANAQTYIADPTAFLFRLRRPGGAAAPEQLLVGTDDKEFLYAYDHKLSQGPSFGFEGQLAFHFVGDERLEEEEEGDGGEGGGGGGLGGEAPPMAAHATCSAWGWRVAPVFCAEPQRELCVSWLMGAPSVELEELEVYAIDDDTTAREHCRRTFLVAQGVLL